MLQNKYITEVIREGKRAKLDQIHPVIVICFHLKTNRFFYTSFYISML